MLIVVDILCCLNRSADFENLVLFPPLYLPCLPPPLHLFLLPYPPFSSLLFLLAPPPLSSLLFLLAPFPPSPSYLLSLPSLIIPSHLSVPLPGRGLVRSSAECTM